MSNIRINKALELYHSAYSVTETLSVRRFWSVMWRPTPIYNIIYDDFTVVYSTMHKDLAIDAAEAMNGARRAGFVDGVSALNCVIED
jgi:hypothetical protein